MNNLAFAVSSSQELAPRQIPFPSSSSPVPAKLTPWDIGTDRAEHGELCTKPMAGGDLPQPSQFVPYLD